MLTRENGKPAARSARNRIATSPETIIPTNGINFDTGSLPQHTGIRNADISLTISATQRDVTGVWPTAATRHRRPA
jgi:hypothetical protein